MSNTTSGVKPGNNTPNKKAAGGYKTTTATISNATLIIAFCARFHWVERYLIYIFSGIFTINNLLKIGFVLLIVLGVAK